MEKELFTRTLPFSGNTPLTAQTSQAAANLLGNARSLRRKVFVAIKAAPGGLTDSEIQTHLGMNGNTQRPRRLELQADGLIESTTTRRQDNNRTAAVWTLTPKGWGVKV
jgi:predicted ArsR family transcriptional regulator